MIEQIVSRLSSAEPTPITQEHFNEWKRSPVTKELFQDILLSYLSQLDEDLPESIDQTIPLVHQREGARKMLDVLVDWEPQSVKEEAAGDENED